MYIKKPMEIETKSMNIIEEIMSSVPFCGEEKIIVKRMIHTTGDIDYRNIIAFKNDFVRTAKQVLQSGVTIFTDTKMVFTGINKPALAKTDNRLLCLIDDEKTAVAAKEKGTTRYSRRSRCSRNKRGICFCHWKCADGIIQTFRTL